MKLTGLILGFVVASVWGRSDRIRETGNEEGDYTGDLLVQVDRVSPDLLQSLLSQEGLDEWSLDPVGHSAIFRVHPAALRSLSKALRGAKSHLRIKHHNVQELIDAEKRDREMLKSSKADDLFGSYHPLEELEKFYKELARDHSDLVTINENIGETFEGRPIMALHFKGAQSEETDKPDKIWVQCLIHAREWISGSTCQYIAKELVDGYDNDERIRDLLDRSEIIMVPVVNPDGYHHTWAKDRLWRKNRHPFRFGTGVDLNRNFAEPAWCKVGASPIPFADTYCGPQAGSEPETQAIQDYYETVKGQVAAAIDVHSFSQLILRPWGNRELPSEDENHLLAASTAMADAIKATHGEVYLPKRSAELYPTTGSATDYYYSLPGQAFRPYSVALELRPGSTASMAGFLLEPKQIRPCVEEVWAGVLAFVEYALDNPLSP